MIQTTGILQTSDGLQFVNPLFNLNIIMPTKFQPTMVNLLIGKIDSRFEPDNTESFYFKSIYDFSILKFEVNNPSFDQLQLLALDELKSLYPSLSFEIV